MVAMASWGEFTEQEPALAESARQLLYQVGVGLAFLATTRADGAPRVHPICPLILEGGMYAFIVPSPKRADLVRDGRFALHSFPCPDNEDAVHLTGRARPVADPRTRAALSQQFVDERSAIGIPPPGDDQHLFAFDLASCLVTRTTGHGDHNPVHTVWHAAPS